MDIPSDLSKKILEEITNKMIAVESLLSEYSNHLSFHDIHFIRKNLIEITILLRYLQQDPIINSLANELMLQIHCICAFFIKK
ncbi:hypothetical protein [Bacillus toyonensis]|uniref:hypothetical protein n=1 Tax=Bacillus toyonensis TaxID=155322 RepID=UPI0011AACEB2|nr:hypothetical protein [Bacillus toyonensis]